MAGGVLWRGSLAQRIRLASGLVLLLFAATHFLNHALGLVGLDVMEAAEQLRTAVTRSTLGSVVLGAALLAHAGLGLWDIVRRRSWRMPVWQWIQVGSGVLIPLLLLPHVVSTRAAASLFGVRTTYPYVLARIWPDGMPTQSLLLLLVWIHGCIGLHHWLRLWPPYRHGQAVLYALAVLVPFAALAGVSVQGRAVSAALAQPAAAGAFRAETGWPSTDEQDRLDRVRDRGRAVYAGLVLAAVGLAGAGLAAAQWRKRIHVHYVGGPTVRTAPGATLLDVSRGHNLPHVSACGGRGRCSTCRVLVLSTGAPLPPPTEAEARTLRAIGAGPGVRLACQTVPTHSLTILPLVKTAAGAALAEAGAAGGVERDLAVLFVDLRGFTALTERKLAFDVIFILNQFFEAVGRPIQEAGGWIANYAGDGLIALFGNSDGLETACRAALLAASGVDRAMEELSLRLMEETRTHLHVAMGLHAGPHVMGRVGFGASQPLSVVGLAVNVASRLETLAKRESVQLAVSGTVARAGGLDPAGFRTEAIAVRGVTEALDVIFVPRASDLLAHLGDTAALAPGLRP